MRRTNEADPAVTTARARETRRAEGLCPRCGAPLESAEETNALTGKPLLRDGAPVVTTRWGRPQHYVDYRGFRRNQLGRRAGLEIPDGPNNYGMVLQHLVAGRWIVPGRPETPPVVPGQLALPVEPKQLSIFDEIAA